MERFVKVVLKGGSSTAYLNLDRVLYIKPESNGTAKVFFAAGDYVSIFFDDAIAEKLK